ncbi:TP53-regulated inhibitor of apoptosis 1-A-like [Tubulanus polymorphus]|uniref:TP53-regulated inhibitor of apoptosis 1-A-like n=1 Tax=Tubulanus polymorphus TaxID=672921 RepID=UPI003DA40E45
MNSVGPECQELKLKYDECFNNWFSGHFLKGSKTDACAPLFKEYQACVKKAVKEQGISVWEIEKDVLGTEEEKKPPEETKSNSK